MKARLVLVASLLVAGCAAPAPSSPAGTPTGSPTAAPSLPSPEPSATPIAELPTWPPEPVPDERFVAIRSLTFLDGSQRLGLDFVGAKAFSPTDPCSADYSAQTAVVDGILEVAIFQSRPPRPAVAPPCDSMGYGRYLEVDLDAPFSGPEWRDLGGAYRHFLAPPDGLVELSGLPAGWELRDGRDVPDSRWGRWERTYSPDPLPAAAERTVVLYQSFGGPVGVTGGDTGTPVEVNGAFAMLYRWQPTGELVLVWRLGDGELALVTYEQTFSLDQLITLAESATSS